MQSIEKGGLYQSIRTEDGYLAIDFLEIFNYLDLLRIRRLVESGLHEEFAAGGEFKKELKRAITKMDKAFLSISELDKSFRLKSKEYEGIEQSFSRELRQFNRLWIIRKKVLEHALNVKDQDGMSEQAILKYLFPFFFYKFDSAEDADKFLEEERFFDPIESFVNLPVQYSVRHRKMQDVEKDLLRLLKSDFVISLPFGKREPIVPNQLELGEDEALKKKIKRSAALFKKFAGVGRDSQNQKGQDPYPPFDEF